ncbi:MAG TPA: S8 family peptidase [Anaerolineales bacterium]|jgi:serine protease AprX
MNALKRTALPRFFMLVTVLALLLGLAGGVPASAAEHQASFIIQAANTELAARLVQAHGGEITSRLEIINAVAANLSDQEAAQLRLEDGIIAITPNGQVNSSDSDRSVKPAGQDSYKDVPVTDYPDVTGADEVWARGVNGSGVTVAVLDTGLSEMPQLTRDEKNNPGRIVAWKDFIEKSKRPVDPNGHGTHVAGIIANSEKGADGEWNGMAPGVDLVGVRVLNEEGAGTYETVINGLQWVIEHKEHFNIRVVNLSLVSPVQSPYWADPLDQAVTATWAKGLTVIVAAGNSGPGAMSISVPGNNPYVVTVGAFTDNFSPSDWNDDYIAPFSAAGPTLDGFSKPDLVAPGGHIVSVTPQDSFLAREYPDNRLQGNYFKLAGTSQATAVVSGMAALVIAQDSELTPNQVKMRLTSTALPWVDDGNNVALYSMWQQGAGRANAFDSVFSKDKKAANLDMDIRADLAGRKHYEGYGYYDETTGTYRLHKPFDGWDGGYGTWNGKYGSWSGKYGSWSGKYGSWSGKYGSWSGDVDAWSGKYGSWSGKYGSWSGKYGSWSGGYTTWAGKYGSWSGSEPWAGTFLADPAFVQSFAAGASPDLSISSATISNFLLEP